MFTDGLGFDGSSIRVFQQIHESDMLLMSPRRSKLPQFFGKRPGSFLVIDFRRSCPPFNQNFLWTE